MPRGKLTKPRAAPVTPDLVRAAGRLAAEGKKAKEIAETLHVALRTAYKLVERATKGGTLATYEPWSLITAVQNNEAPERARWLIESGQDWDGDGRRAATRKEADWAWMIHSVRPDLSVSFVSRLVSRYTEAEDTPRLKWTAQVLDRALRRSPWESQDNALSFYAGTVHCAPAQQSPDRISDLAVIADIEIWLRRMWRMETDASSALAPSITINPDDLNPEIRVEIIGLTNLRLQDDARPLEGFICSPFDEHLRFPPVNRPSLPWDERVATAINDAIKALGRRAKGGKQ